MITASDIIALLAQKHSKDVFVPLCKTGPTWNAVKGELLVLDAWALKRSWTKPLITGYEIKISRQDFRVDQKWPRYLEFCHEFYFVSPPDVIDPREIPPQIGLYHTSQNGGRLFLKKKCPLRLDARIPDSILYYIIICRSKIGNDTAVISKKEYWESWIQHKTVDHEFGCRVSKTIRETIKNEIQDTQKENRNLKYELEKFAKVKELLEKWGLPVSELSKWSIEDQLREKIQLIQNGVPGGFAQSLAEAINKLMKVQDLVEGMHDEARKIQINEVSLRE